MSPQPVNWLLDAGGRKKSNIFYWLNGISTNGVNGVILNLEKNLGSKISELINYFVPAVVRFHHGKRMDGVLIN